MASLDRITQLERIRGLDRMSQGPAGNPYRSSARSSGACEPRASAGPAGNPYRSSAVTDFEEVPKKQAAGGLKFLKKLAG